MGVSTILLNLALVLFGANVLRAPVQLGTSAIDVGSYSMVSGQIITFVVGISLAVLLHLFMHRTYLGRALRAVAQHRYAATLMGVNVNNVTPSRSAWARPSSASPPACWRRSTRCSRPWARTSC